jgi:hypothetical protein
MASIRQKIKMFADDSSDFRHTPGRSPVCCRDLAVTHHDGLAGHALAAAETAGLAEPYLDRCWRAEILGSGEHADSAACTDANAAARVSERGAGAAGEVEQRFVVARSGCFAERRERHES